MTLLETSPVFLSLRDNLLYENNKTRAISPDDQTEYFEIKVDVLQDEILVPHLYVIVLECILTQNIPGLEGKARVLTEQKKPMKNQQLPSVTLNLLTI